MAAFVAFVKATFGNSPDVLADFGLKPKKATTPLTVEQKAAAAAKREGNARGAAHDGNEAEEGREGNDHHDRQPHPFDRRRSPSRTSPVASAPTQSAGGAGAAAAPHAP